MTDVEIVKVLTRGRGANYDYFSRDGLAIVIGEMTEEERDEVNAEMWALWINGGYHKTVGQSVWLLTCDPRVIAGCIAKAIQKGKA